MTPTDDARFRDLLDKAVTLLPVPCTVVFLADRGFADTDLMAHERDRFELSYATRLKRAAGL